MRKNMAMLMVVTLMVVGLTGCPSSPTPTPNPVVKLRAWSIWTEGNPPREYSREVFNLEEVAVDDGNPDTYDPEAYFDFAGDDFVSGRIGYKLTGTADMVYIAVTPESDKSAAEKSSEKSGFYYGGVWHPEYWYCGSCYAWYHGPCCYHGCDNGHDIDIDIDLDIAEIIEALAIDNFPSPQPALTEDGEFSIAVPMGPTVETAVLNVSTKNGSFIITIRGEAYNGGGEEDQYTLTTSVQGSGTVTGAGTYDAGTQVTITATAATGWHFDHWVVNDTIADNNPGTITMDSDVILVGVFTQNAVAKHTLTTSVVGSGTVTGAGTYDAGTVVTVTATAATGWHFDHWLVNGTVANNNPGTITMDSDVILVGVFTQNAVAKHTLTTSVVGSGTVTGAGTYDAGTVVTVTATAATGWSFSYWAGGGANSTANPITVIMNDNVTLTAVFIQNAVTKYTLTTSVVGSGTVTGAGTYDAGTQVTVTATPAVGWHFKHLVVTVGGVDKFSSNNPIVQVTMDKNTQVTLMFEQDAIAKYTLTTSVVGSGTVSGAGVYDAGTVVTVTATAATGWHFDHWATNGEEALNNPTDINLSGNMSVVAYFIQTSAGVEFTSNGVTGTMRINPGALTLRQIIAADSAQFLPADATFDDIVSIGVEIVNLPGPYWYIRECENEILQPNQWSQVITLDGFGVDSNGNAKGQVPLAKWGGGRAIPFCVLSTAPGRIFSLNTGVNSGTLNGNELDVDTTGFIWPK